MNRNFFRKGAFTLMATTGLVGAAFAMPGGAHASGISFSTAVVGSYGGEPSLTSDMNGVLYDTTPSGPQTYRSVNQGVSWTNIQSPDNNSGDTCLNTDSENSLYWCNLGSTTVGSAPLQADVWKSTSPTITTCTNACGWQYGNNAVTGGQCSTSCNPFGVDRQWVASYITPGQHSNTAEVVLMYHDFYGPSHIWVNISHDGGATFGAAQEVLSSPAITTGAIPNTLLAEGYTFCNTVPLNVGIAQPGTAHAGRIFVSWIAADPVSDVAGCNLSQDEPFHTAWVSYSDDGGSTWTPQLAFDAGLGRDLSTPFASFTLDDRGNPYIAFNSEPPAPNTVTDNAGQLQQPTTCKTETDQQTATGSSNLQSDPGCSYDTYVVWSQDGGATWDGGGGGRGNPLAAGAAATAYLVNDASHLLGTSLYATIAVGDPGQVDVSYLYTPENEPQGDGALGKFDPLGCAGPSTAKPNYPPRCQWNLIAGQSLTLTSPPTATSSFTNAPVTTTPMHYGDICNLGIACAPVTPNPRHLLDFNQETIDPTTGCAHIGYADDNSGTTYGIPNNYSPNGNHLVAANQTTGCLTLTAAPGTPIPEAPTALLLLPAGLAAAVVAGVAGRRRRQRLAA